MRKDSSFKGLLGGVAAAGLACASCVGPGASREVASVAMPAPEPVGDWKGVLQAGAMRLRVAAHITKENEVLSGTAVNVDQGGAGVPLAGVSAEENRLSFEVPSVGGRFAGTWDAAKQAYVGEWSHQTARIPLELTRGTFPVPPVAPVAPAALLPPAAFRYKPAAAAIPRFGPTLAIGKCINMSNMLDAPSEGEWGPAISDDDFAFIAKAGFKTIRLPVRWSAHAAVAAPYTIDPAFMARVHHVVDLAKAARLNVILNLHHYSDLTEEPDAHRMRFAALWRQIAASFASEPDSVWFELMNEPNGKLDASNLLEVLRPALAAVRKTNPTRPVLIGGENWSGLASLATLELPDDANVVPTFHYYDPFAFTHQGAAWAAPNVPPIGRRYGLAQDKALLDRDIATVKSYIDRTGRVPILGEYGAQDDPRVPVEDRIRYYGAVSAAFASVGVPSCAWGYASGFRLRDRDGWIPGIVESLAAPGE